MLDVVCRIMLYVGRCMLNYVVCWTLYVELCCMLDVVC